MNHCSNLTMILDHAAASRLHTLQVRSVSRGVVPGLCHFLSYLADARSLHGLQLLHIAARPEAGTVTAYLQGDGAELADLMQLVASVFPEVELPATPGAHLSKNTWALLG